MKRFISFSGGVESSTMCLLYGKDAKAIFADTGWEHKAMYDRLDMVEKEIKITHPMFEVILVKNKKYSNLQNYIKTQKFYPSVMARYCTRLFKIEPIDEFLKSQGECELMIGLNADEGDRAGNHEMLANVKYTYPLLENGITREACIEILEKANLKPRLPVYMQRGGCIGCFFKSKKEFVAMIHLSENEFDEVMEIEETMQDMRASFFSIRDNIPSLKGLKKSEENLLFNGKEAYSEFIDVGTPCGIYCHR